MIQAVLFDMDGVLLDSFDAWLALLNGTARNFGHPPVTAEAFRAGFGGATSTDVERFFPDQTVESLETYYEAHFDEHAHQVRTLPHASDVIETLDSKGIPSAVITNTPSAIARLMLEAAGLKPHALVSGSDVPKPKPAPDVIFRACEVLSVEPWDALVVGDSSYDKQAAASAGVLFAGIGGVAGNFIISDLIEVVDIVEGRI